MVLSNGFAVVHGIKGGNLVDSHGGHFEHPGDLIHHADTGEAMLTLSEIEKRHDSSLLVLWRVSFQDLIDEGEVLGGEFEGDGRVVRRFISMLKKGSSQSAIINWK